MKDELAGTGTSIEIKTASGINLKKFSLADASVIFDLIDSERSRFTQPGVKAGETYKTIADVETSITNPQNPNRLRFGIWNDDNKYIGSINLTPDENNLKRAEIGYYLGSKYEKRGYMQKAITALTSWAFQNRGIEEIWASVDKGNADAARSSNTLLKAGFVESGVEGDETIFTLRKP